MSSGKDAFQGWVVGWLLAVQSSVPFCLRADLVGGHASTSLCGRGLCKVESVIDARLLCRSRPR